MSRYSQGTISLEKMGGSDAMESKNRTSMGASQKYTLETRIQIGYNKKRIFSHLVGRKGFEFEGSSVQGVE
jgi:hypothetical protein